LTSVTSSSLNLGVQALISERLYAQTTDSL